MEYDNARRVLQGEDQEAQDQAGDQRGDAAEVLSLIQAVLSGLDPDRPGSASPAAGPAEVLAALTLLRHLREKIAGWEPWLIAAARDQGVSWAGLAPALGVTSRQAAERRYLRLRPSADGESTGEQRVQAERTRRAGDRAVAQWARQNSSALRRLAGKVSALEDLTAQAQQHADRVTQALGEDDPTALLSPLVDAHLHLKTSHSGLAEQIDAIAGHTEQLRRDTRDRRLGTPDASSPGLPGGSPG